MRTTIRTVLPCPADLLVSASPPPPGAYFSDHATARSNPATLLVTFIIIKNNDLQAFDIAIAAGALPPRPWYNESASPRSSSSPAEAAAPPSPGAYPVLDPHAFRDLLSPATSSSIQQSLPASWYLIFVAD